jgi:hypothetical protein
LKPTPPLFANGILFLLAIFLSAGAFRDYGTIEDVLSLRPQRREKHWIIEWAEDVLDDPVFPEMSQDVSSSVHAESDLNCLCPPPYLWDATYSSYTSILCRCSFIV